MLDSDFTFKVLEPIPANSNPFLFDMSRTGQSAGENDNWEIMWDSFDNGLVLVHKPSGKRIEINIA